MESDKLHVYSTILFVKIQNTQILMYWRGTETFYCVTLNWNHRIFSTAENCFYCVYHLL